MLKITVSNQSVEIFNPQQEFPLRDENGDEHWTSLVKIVCSKQTEEFCGGRCPLADICGWHEGASQRALALIKAGLVPGVTAEEVWYREVV